MKEAKGQVLILSHGCVCECYLRVSCPTLSVSCSDDPEPGLEC